MRYTLQCKDCKRLAPVISQRAGRTKFGYATVTKTVSHTCNCGGKDYPNA